MSEKRNWIKIKDYTDILFDFYEGIARITINRPRVYNAFRPDTNQEILDALTPNKYYRNNEGKCTKCLEKCQNCINGNTCIECENNYFISSDSTQCIHYNNLTNCKTKTHSGCTECKDGYFVSNQYCSTCESKTQYCTKCDKFGTCNSCQENYILNEQKQCIHFNQITNCQKSSNNKCSECSFWNKPSENGLTCETAPVWWVIVLAVIAGLLIITLIIVLFAFIVNKIMKTIKDNKLRKEFNIFNMKNSGIDFIETENPDIVVNTKELRFVVKDPVTSEEIIQIPVEKETCQSIYVGNNSKNTIKVQFSMKEGTYKYSIRTEPQVMTIPKEKALEFKIFITPFCTTNVNETIKLISANLKKGMTTETDIKIHAETELTTRLDPDELIQEKKLGEGSFGIVFLGNFRGYKVAIKKMKNVSAENEGDNNNAMEEFEKEVSMLDKFRCDYIIHFYGAVFILNKICMVTEFATHGSLQDLIKKDIEMKDNLSMKIKLLLDAAKGIHYLHENGIFHRDIKPDNILVISLEENVKANAKLTDFGSARNVNMMMTNMTFTKGIGSPAYMAPEILNREKYKKTADIFSFAITMLETMIWGDAYPKSIYKFPWDIADTISAGKRPSTIDSVENEKMKELIDLSWKQDPKERLKMNEIIELLESEYQKVSKENISENGNEIKNKQISESNSSSESDELNESVNSEELENEIEDEKKSSSSKISSSSDSSSEEIEENKKKDESSQSSSETSKHSTESNETISKSYSDSSCETNSSSSE